MPLYENTFYEAGGWSFAPLTPHEWWVLWQALNNRQDEAKAAEALRTLGSLVQTDWLDSIPPVPDEGHPPERLQAMFRAHDQYQDDWLKNQSDFAVSRLGYLCSSPRPYSHRELENTARSLVELAGELFRVANDREEEIERGDRDE